MESQGIQLLCRAFAVSTVHTNTNEAIVQLGMMIGIHSRVPFQAPVSLNSQG